MTRPWGRLNLRALLTRLRATWVSARRSPRAVTGVSGAWIGNLTALETYKLVFIGIAAVFIAAGFWHVYFRKAEPCEDGTACARPDSARFTKAALWISAILVLLAATIDYWAPLFY